MLLLTRFWWHIISRSDGGHMARNSAHMTRSFPVSKFQPCIAQNCPRLPGLFPKWVASHVAPSPVVRLYSWLTKLRSSRLAWLNLGQQCIDQANVNRPKVANAAAGSVSQHCSRAASFVYTIASRLRHRARILQKNTINW